MRTEIRKLVVAALVVAAVLVAVAAAPAPAFADPSDILVTDEAAVGATRDTAAHVECIDLPGNCHPVAADDWTLERCRYTIDTVHAQVLETCSLEPLVVDPLDPTRVFFNTTQPGIYILTARLEGTTMLPEPVTLQARYSGSTPAVRRPARLNGLHAGARR